MINDKELQDSLNGFEVADEIEVGDLSELKEERSILPPTKAVKLRIRKVTTQMNEDKTYRSLNMSLSVEDGILVNGEVKFKGMVVWGRVNYYADPKVYTKDYFKKKQHLNELKKLVLATGGDVANIKVNDEFCRNLENMVVLADIKQEINKFTAKDGTKVEETRNYVTNYKATDPTSMV